MRYHSLDPKLGYVPKVNLLHDRWIATSGWQAAFIKRALAAGMLGAAEAHKISADMVHYLLEVHELAGQNQDGGFDSALCSNICSQEVHYLHEVLLRVAQDDKLWPSVRKDPCPMRTKKQTLTLPCGALP